MIVSPSYTLITKPAVTGGINGIVSAHAGGDLDEPLVSSHASGELAGSLSGLHSGEPPGEPPGLHSGLLAGEPPGLPVGASSDEMQPISIRGRPVQLTAVAAVAARYILFE